VWLRAIDRLEANTAQRVIDVGCGPGQFAELLLSRLSVGYLGLDFSSVAVSMARTRCPTGRFECLDISKDDLSRFSPFDAVVSIEFLEHVEDDRSILKSLPPRTFVVASVPNYDSFGHVRYFQSANEVRIRYSDLFSQFDIEVMEMSPSTKVFIFCGLTC
jgi:2-polyprenyl-3-methyl-5-hydroxy-6-metoxy-1,4-benzoquinol methylase